MTKDEALKMALETLEIWKGYMPHLWDKTDEQAITAIKEALMSDTDGAQPEQEPVTWRYKIVDVFGRPAWTLKTPKSDTRVLESQPLYTRPPPVASPHKRPSRSDIKPLTDEEIILIVAECASSHQHTDIHFARAIEQAHGIKGLV